MKIKIIAVLATALLLGGCAVQSATATPALVSTTVARESSMIATATDVHDIRVVGSIPAPQIILTTPAALFDGGPVQISLTAEYANMIPDPASQLNGLGFEIYLDGQYVTRLGLFGSHSQVSLYGPINLSAIFDDAQAIPAGAHTVSIGVWKWSAGGDGYLKGSDGAPAVPVRLTVAHI